eukprot:1104540-Amphidinium_carterae.1
MSPPLRPSWNFCGSAFSLPCYGIIILLEACPGRRSQHGACVVDVAAFQRGSWKGRRRNQPFMVTRANSMEGYKTQNDWNANGPIGAWSIAAPTGPVKGGCGVMP